MKNSCCFLSFVLTLTALLVIFVGCDTDEPGEREPTVEQIITPPTPPAATDAVVAATDAVVPEEPVNGEVLFYTGETWWIDKADARFQAVLTEVNLIRAGIQARGTEDANEVRRWMLQTRNNGAIDVLVLYGDVPDTIYPPGNVQPDGSLVETWLETPDGDTVLNHADWVFWGGERAKNREAGLQNIMDIPGITLFSGRPDGDGIPMRVTVAGRTFTPSLKDFRSDRPFRLDQLRGNWFAELVLARGDGDANRADPVIVRDGALGRIAIVHQTLHGDEPIAEVASEIIMNYLMK